MSVFRFSQLQDERGDYTDAKNLPPSSSRPLPFDCVITPRFPDAQAIVARTRELL